MLRDGVATHLRVLRRGTARVQSDSFLALPQRVEEGSSGKPRKYGRSEHLRRFELGTLGHSHEARKFTRVQGVASSNLAVPTNISTLRRPAVYNAAADPFVGEGGARLERCIAT